MCTKGYNADVGAFTQYYGSDALDASLLMIPLVGFLPAGDERVRSTVEVIERGLTEDGFVLRYQTEDTGAVDGLTGHEGAFLACSFWMADCLHLIGRYDDAHAMLDRLIGLRNDLGLLAEEYDVRARTSGGELPPGLLARLARERRLQPVGARGDGGSGRGRRTPRPQRRQVVGSDDLDARARPAASTRSPYSRRKRAEPTPGARSADPTATTPERATTPKRRRPR